MVYNSCMAYIVNGIPVGNDPPSIERNKSYMEFFHAIGNSADNIKVVPNFLTKEEIEYLMKDIDDRPYIRFVSQKDHEGNPLTYMHQYSGLEDVGNIIEKCREQIAASYGIEKEKIRAKETHLSVVKWTPGTYLKLHVDDLGYVTDNHLPVLIYLNDAYEGGEISFELHDMSIKPNIGDFIVFPGNLHYPHEVKEVLSGVRYTLPIWFTIV
jgi:hypothetical protein